MKKHQFRKLLTVGAAGLLALQLVAGTSLAAGKPLASATGQGYNFAGNGNAGFSFTYVLQDNTTLSKLYLEADITGASAIALFAGSPVIFATKNGVPVANACTGQAGSPLVLKCAFKTVRTGEVIEVRVGVVPSAAAVTTTGIWSASGYVPGDNQSHGDAWMTDLLAANRVDDPSGNSAQGFGNDNLTTNLTLSSTNPQAARLANLPAGVYAKVADNISPETFTCTVTPAFDCTGFSGDVVALEVNDGALFTAPFQLQIKYQRSASAPTLYVHTSDEYPQELVYPCASKKGDITYPCFTWSNSTSTATLFLLHNGLTRKA